MGGGHLTVYVWDRPTNVGTAEGGESRSGTTLGPPASTRPATLRRLIHRVLRENDLRTHEARSGIKVCPVPL